MDLPYYTWNNTHPIKFDTVCILKGFHGQDLMVVMALWAVLKVVLPNIALVSVVGIFRRQESELCLCSGAVSLDS